MKSEEKPAKTYKLDIFDSLRAIDSKDRGYLSRQDTNIQKGFAPRVVLRWTSAVSNSKIAADYIWFSNEIANKQFDELAHYPDLQFQLLTVCGAGTQQRHQWIEMPKQTKTLATLHNFVAKFWPRASIKEIDLLISQFTKDTFIDFVDSSGVSLEETKELVNAFGKHSTKKIEG